MMKDKLSDMIQDAVGGCAKYWADVIAEKLVAEGVTILPEGAIVLTRAELDALGKYEEKLRSAKKMSREKQSKRQMRKELDKALDAVGLGADFMTPKEKKEFIKYVQDMGETIPPKEFHTSERKEYKYAFSKNRKNVDMKFNLSGTDFKGMFDNCRTLTEEEIKETLNGYGKRKAD